MKSVTLTWSELLRLLKIFVYLSAALAVAIAVGKSTFSETTFVVSLIQGLSGSVVLMTLVLGFISKRAWTSPRLSRWLERPVAHGVWWGTLHTDYRAKGALPVGPIPIVFVIRQTYFFLSIQSFTANQDACSTMEALNTNEKTSDARLSYVFEMRRTAYAENKITTGYGDLTLLDSGQRLAGHYWTNSPTQGRLELTLLQRDCDSINSFRAAERLRAQ